MVRAMYGMAGGVPEGVAASLWALHQELQPDAVAFQGPDVNTQPNLIRWAGTEGGHVKYLFLHNYFPVI